jgi:4-methyl-5(b-hydroxyethyl)-thiazole monophosphate biosynthesis
MSKKVLVPIADGIEEIEAVTVIDVLRRAGAQVTVAGVDKLQITASRGVKIVADCPIAECVDTSYDLIVLPGGMPGAEHLKNCPELTAMLKAQVNRGNLYAAICASPAVVLQHHGLIGTRRATCHPAYIHKLDNASATESRVVVDGRCITSRGPGTALEFALKLVEILFDKPKAEEVAMPMLVSRSTVKF